MKLICIKYENPRGRISKHTTGRALERIIIGEFRSCQKKRYRLGMSSWTDENFEFYLENSKKNTIP